MMRYFLFLLVMITQARAADIKIATWNLDWLTLRSIGDPALPGDVQPRQKSDFGRLHDYAEKLAADVVAFQEVDGIEAAAYVFDPYRYTLLAIHQRVVQRVGLAVRRDIEVTQNPDVAAFDVAGPGEARLRDGLDATLIFPGGARLRILVVHLKTGCQYETLARSRRPQCILFREQIAPLAAWVAARGREGVAFAVLGDLNRELDRPEELGRALALAAPMVRATAGQSSPCWQGGSFIDHILVGGAARDWLVPGSLRVQVFAETGSGWKDRLSDHCPVSARLRVP